MLGDSTSHLAVEWRSRVASVSSLCRVDLHTALDRNVRRERSTVFRLTPSHRFIPRSHVRLDIYTAVGRHHTSRAARVHVRLRSCVLCYRSRCRFLMRTATTGRGTHLGRGSRRRGIPGV